MDKGKMLGENMVLELRPLIPAQAENVIRLEAHLVGALFVLLGKYHFQEIPPILLFTVIGNQMFRPALFLQNLIFPKGIGENCFPNGRNHHPGYRFATEGQGPRPRPHVPVHTAERNTVRYFHSKGTLSNQFHPNGIFQLCFWASAANILPCSGAPLWLEAVARSAPPAEHLAAQLRPEYMENVNSDTEPLFTGTIRRLRFQVVENLLLLIGHRLAQALFAYIVKQRSISARTLPLSSAAVHWALQLEVRLDKLVEGLCFVRQFKAIIPRFPLVNEVQRIAEHVHLVTAIGGHTPRLTHKALCTLSGQKVNTVEERCGGFLIHAIEHVIAASLGARYPVGKALCLLEKSALRIDLTIYFVKVDDKEVQIAALGIVQVEAHTQTFSAAPSVFAVQIVLHGSVSIFIG